MCVCDCLCLRPSVCLSMFGSKDVEVLQRVYVSQMCNLSVCKHVCVRTLSYLSHSALVSASIFLSPYKLSVLAGATVCLTAISGPPP